MNYAIIKVQHSNMDSLDQIYRDGSLWLWERLGPRYSGLMVAPPGYCGESFEHVEEKWDVYLDVSENQLVWRIKDLDTALLFKLTWGGSQS